MTQSKSKNSYLINKQLNYYKKNVSSNKTKVMGCKTERIILVENPEKIPETLSTNTLLSIRRETFLVREKENVPVIKKNILGRDTMLTSPERSIKRPYQICQDHVFNNHFSFKNLNNSSSSISDDSLEKPSIKIDVNYSQINDFCFTPLKSTENLFSPIGTMQKSNSFNKQLSVDITDGSLATTSLNSSYKLEDSLTTDVTYTAENRIPPKVSINLCSNFTETIQDGLNNASTNILLNTELKIICFLSFV